MRYLHEALEVDA